MDQALTGVSAGLGSGPLPQVATGYSAGESLKKPIVDAGPTNFANQPYAHQQQQFTPFMGQGSGSLPQQPFVPQGPQHNPAFPKYNVLPDGRPRCMVPEHAFKNAVQMIK